MVCCVMVCWCNDARSHPHHILPHNAHIPTHAHSRQRGSRDVLPREVTASRTYTHTHQLGTMWEVLMVLPSVVDGVALYFQHSTSGRTVVYGGGKPFLRSLHVRSIQPTPALGRLHQRHVRRSWYCTTLMAGSAGCLTVPLPTATHVHSMSFALAKCYLLTSASSGLLPYVCHKVYGGLQGGRRDNANMQAVMGVMGSGGEKDREARKGGESSTGREGDCGVVVHVGRTYSVPTRRK